jgi:DNA-binding CsgD family transcriptional regulator
MVREMAPASRRRLGAQSMLLRRRRIFSRLREGLSYEEIASEEGVSRERIRQIVSEVLQKRSVDSGADHAKLQLDRLAPAMQLAAEAIAAGDVTAIAPYLKVLDRLDRYQSVAGAHQVYDDEARAKLLAKINRIADNLGVDEVMRAAAREHLKKLGEIVDEASETDGRDAPEGSPTEEQREETCA